MTVATLRRHLEQLEARGYGYLDVQVLCDVSPETPGGTCGFGLCVHEDADMLLLDYTAEPGEVMLPESCE